MVLCGALVEEGGKGRCHALHHSLPGLAKKSEGIERCIGRGLGIRGEGQRRERNGATFPRVPAAGRARAVLDGHGEFSGKADHFPMSSLLGTSRSDQCGSGAFR
jgi:hypothetical protein